MGLAKAVGLLVYLLLSPTLANILIGKYVPFIGYVVIGLNFVLIVVAARRSKRKAPTDDRLQFPKVCTVCWKKYPETVSTCPKCFTTLVQRKSLGDNF